MPNPCIYCEHYNDCDTDKETEEYCFDFSLLDSLVEDDYIDAIIEEQRVSFRAEWFSYISSEE